MKYPWLFVLILVVMFAAALLAWWKWRRSPVVASLWVSHTESLRRLPAYQKERSRTLWGVVGSGLALLILAGGASVSAGLPITRNTQHPQLASRDIVLCLDASGSMLPYDGQILRSFRRLLEGFEGERLALQLWSAQTVKRFPLTDDYELIEEVLNEAAAIIDRGYLGPEGDYVLVTQELAQYLDGIEAPDGQAISSLVGDGLATCVTGFDNLDTDRSRTILLATDNEVMGEQIYTLAQAVDLASSYDVEIVAFYPAQGGVLTAEGEQLRSIVEAAGGDFYDAADPAAVPGVIDRIVAEQLSDLDGEPTVVETTVPRTALLWSAWGLLLFLAVRVVRR